MVIIFLDTNGRVQKAEQNNLEFIHDENVKVMIKSFDVEEYNRLKDSQKNRMPDMEVSSQKDLPSPDGLVKEIKQEFKSFQEEIKFKELEDAGKRTLSYFYVIFYCILKKRELNFEVGNSFCLN